MVKATANRVTNKRGNLVHGKQTKKKRISERTVQLARTEVRGKMRRLTKIIYAMEYNRDLSEAIRRDAELGPELCLLGRQLWLATTGERTQIPCTEESDWVWWLQTLADDIMVWANEANRTLVELHAAFLKLQDDPHLCTIVPGKEVGLLRQRHQRAYDYFLPVYDADEFFSTGLLKEDDVDAADRGVGGGGHTHNNDGDGAAAAHNTATATNEAAAGRGRERAAARAH